jgi:drug/metabolite transporter (DMT)-like permease
VSAPLAPTTAAALLAFAANSLLCRFALGDGGADPAGFTALRLASGALVLGVLLAWRAPRLGSAVKGLLRAGSWRGAIALFAYASGFSWAYVQLDAAAGALLLFAAVQATMLVAGLLGGERFGALQWSGFALAAAGVLTLLLPGARAPALSAALPMLGAGVAWGLYSLWGRGATDALADTAGNFARSLPFALGLWLLVVAQGPTPLPLDAALAAVASGALASGLAYVAWYAVLPRLGALRAAALQLTVPLITAIGAVLLLGEAFGLRLALATVGIVGGIALVLHGKRAARA